MIFGVLTIQEAQSIVLAATRPLPSEEVALADAHRRVLAEDVIAANDVPPFDNSAMDGYAVRGSGLTEFAVVGESRAGAPYDGEIGEGEAVVISTGAAVPAGAEAVVPVERVEKSTAVGDFSARIVAAGAIHPGDHVRRSGEDQRAGTTVLHAGTRLGPAELGVAAGAGRAGVSVAQRPRVAIVATGDELVAPGEPLEPGQIHETNALSLAALAATQGATVTASLRAPDDHDATRDTLHSALENADVLIVSGGVSVGPHDHVKPALLELGVEERFWRVALRPGKPTWFGTRDGTLVFGLPGNPVSAQVTFLLFARPALQALQGNPAPAKSLRLPLAAAAARHPDRDEALRVRITPDGLAETTGPQGSHQLLSLAGADGLAMIPQGDGELPAGTVVDVLLLA